MDEKLENSLSEKLIVNNAIKNSQKKERESFITPELRPDLNIYVNIQPRQDLA